MVTIWNQWRENMQNRIAWLSANSNRYAQRAPNIARRLRIHAPNPKNPVTSSRFYSLIQALHAQGISSLIRAIDLQSHASSLTLKPCR